MKSLGLLFIVLIVSGGARAEGPPNRADHPLGPENEIDMLAYKIYQRRLREEQEQRQMERERERQLLERAGLGYMEDLRRDVEEPVVPAPPPGGATSQPPTGSTAYSHQVQAVHVDPPSDSSNDIVFTAVVAGCSVAGLVGLVVAGVCWYRLQKNVKAASEAEYPAYGITGPTNERVQSPGDRKLAQSAQMYHYQHQKQQMIALEKANSEMKQDGSDEESEEENEEGDYTVYECPGLAPTGEMEVKNPLFSEDTPVTPTAPGPADHK